MINLEICWHTVHQVLHVCLLLSRFRFNRVSLSPVCLTFLEDLGKVDQPPSASIVPCWSPWFKVTEDHLRRAFFLPEECCTSWQVPGLAGSLETQSCSSRAAVLQVFWSSVWSSLMVNVPHAVPSSNRSRCGLLTVSVDQTCLGTRGERLYKCLISSRRGGEKLNVSFASSPRRDACCLHVQVKSS